MKTSAAGVKFIQAHEGLRLFAYLDSANVPTIGYGHTKGVHLGMHISEQRAEELLREDLAWAEDAVTRAVTVQITQGQFDALVSFVFNVGAGAFQESTLLRKLNAGDTAGAADEFLRWNKATVNGAKVVLPGLTKRRTDERELFKMASHARPGPSSPAPEPPRPAPAPLPPPSPSQPKQPDPSSIYGQEHSMPIPVAGIAAALLPTLIESIPKLGKLFGSGSAVSDRNLAAAGTVLEIVQTATQSVNAQEAVEKIGADPAARAAAKKAVESRWYELIEAGGGGIDGARKADQAVMFNEGPWWQVFRSPSFIVALPLLGIVIMIVGAVVGLWGQPFSEDVRSAIANGIPMLILGGLIGYYYGQITSRNRAAP